MDEATVARFWSRVQRGAPDACWEWQRGTGSNGYGKFGGLAHRIAYELAVGPIPDGKLIRHKCDNKVCCNPAHLEPGTYADNNRDATERKRWRPRRGSANGKAKLTEAQVAFIRTNRGVMLQRELGAMFGIRKNTVSQIQLGRRWR